MRWQVCNTEEPDHAPCCQSLSKTNETDRSDPNRDLRSNYSSYAGDFCTAERSSTVQSDNTGHEPEIPDQARGPGTDGDREKRRAAGEARTSSTHSEISEWSRCNASTNPA